MHQPVLLRRTNSITPSSSGAAASTVQNDPSIATADEADPGPVLNASSHKRKQSHLPLESDLIVSRDGRARMEGIEQESDVEEGDSPLILSASGHGRPAGPDLQQVFDNVSKPSSPLFSPRGICLLAAITTVVSIFVLRPPPKSAMSDSAQRPMDAKSEQYGDFHIEVVGEGKEAVPKYNWIEFYDDPARMKPLVSKGPQLFDRRRGGLFSFRDVCLTNNIDAPYSPDHDTTLRGLIYFTDDDNIASNPKRCIPCSNNDSMETWDAPNTDENTVGHKCGMTGLHAMYAASVIDWTTCVAEESNKEQMKDWGQTQTPTQVETVHFFDESTFLLQFHADDMESSLFDMLMTYLPHWYSFQNDDEYPFESVISHSIKGCLSHSHNWFCEVMHQINAFGPAKEIPWEPNNTTLYCFKELMYNQGGYQRQLSHEGLITREIMDKFRETLFRKLALPRKRTHKELNKKNPTEAASGANNSNAKNEADTKIIFYDNKLAQKTVWNGMDSLVARARSLEKYQNVKFVTVEDFSDLTVAEQARSFNEADAVIMVHGQHMANAIFSVEGTSFVEVGCAVSSLVGNPRFMELIDGNFRTVERCNGGENEGACVVCGDEGDPNFTMTPEAFEKLVDDVLEGLQE